MRFILTIIITLLLSISVFSQKEAGDYDRPSITFIPHLLDVDGTVRNMSQYYKNSVIKRMAIQLVLPRFDYNNLPKKMYDQIEKSIPSVENSCIGNRDECFETVSQLIKKDVSPVILNVMQSYMEQRASHIMSEQERNSFITDKAKELGYTEAEIRRVLNSAYIFMPFASNYRAFHWNDTSFTYQEVTRNGKKTYVKKID